VHIPHVHTAHKSGKIIHYEEFAMVTLIKSSEELIDRPHSCIERLSPPELKELWLMEYPYLNLLVP
jgi:hypothetical protein